MAHQDLRTRMVVVAHRPGRRAAIRALVVIGFVLVAATSFQYGQMRAGGDLMSVERLLSEQETSTQKNVELERRLADAKLSTAVDSEANEELRRTIKSLRDELADTEEEVRFYRELMAPSESQKGLRIEKLDLNRVDSERYEYRLMLTQIVDRHEWVKGDVQLSIVGLREGNEQVLSLTDLSEVEEYPIKFKFRYFQEFTGSVAIPVGFEPARILVTAQASGAERQLQRTFPWTVQES
jgi:hypothetical protein